MQYLTYERQSEEKKLNFRMLYLIPVRTVGLTVLRTEQSSEKPELKQARLDTFRSGPSLKE